MKKNIVSAILLAFVGVSVLVLVMKESGKQVPAVQAATPTISVAGKRVIAYYFHGVKRCATCRKIETYTREAIETGYSVELKDGLLVFETVNVDKRQNEHFVTDFKLTTRSVVLVEIAGGEQKRWKNLSRIWELVGDESAFREYIDKEVAEYLEGVLTTRRR